MYTSYRCDQADAWGEVIIITKKNLTVEEIKISKECEMVAIKGETYQKPVIFASCTGLLKALTMNYFLKK